MFFLQKMRTGKCSKFSKEKFNNNLGLPDNKMSHYTPQKLSSISKLQDREKLSVFKL